VKIGQYMMEVREKASWLHFWLKVRSFSSIYTKYGHGHIPVNKDLYRASLFATFELMVRVGSC